MPAASARHRAILDFALSSLRRRSGRNLTLLAVYTLTVTLLASLLFFVAALRREARLLLQDAPDITVQRLMAGRHELVPAARAVDLAAIRGVTSVTPRFWGYYYDALNGANYTLQVDPALEGDQARVGNAVAATRRLATGDILPLTGSDRRIVLLAVTEVLPQSADLLAADLLVVSPDAFQRLFALPAGQATDLAVTVRNPREVPTVAAKIAERFPDSRPILKSELLRTYDSVIDWRGGMALVLLAGTLISFAILAWDKATGLSAEERREIGILKSVGWDTGDVLLLKFWEGAAISLVAYLGGVLLAYLHVYLLGAPLFARALKGWSVLNPEFALAPSLDAGQLVVLFCLSVLPYAVATVVPCWRVAISPPDSALRS